MDGDIEEGGRRQNRWGKLICMSTQFYDVPSVWIVNRYVGILLVELDRIQNCYLKAEKEIVFQTVILKHVSLMSGSRNIHDCI